VSSGLVLSRPEAGPQLAVTILAVGLFLYVGRSQGVAAREWLVGGLEPKLPMVCSIGSWADAGGHYRWMALMLGLAASFHVLVGGWAFLAVVGWLVLRRKTHLSILGIWGRFF